MARPEDLYPGNCYFLVNFHDNNLLFPDIYTFTYLECEEDSDGRRCWLFEDPPHSTKSDDAGVEDERILMEFSDDRLYQILDFPGLIKVLGEVATDHPISPLGLSSRPVANSRQAELRQEVSKFLANDEYLSLSITIVFTDDALHLGRRREGGFEMGFFTKPRREPDEESKIRSMFASIGTTPHVDYLSNGGRTRVLDFAIPDDLSIILNLCDRVFDEIYSIRYNDSLRYSFLLRSDIDRMQTGSESTPS